MEALAGNKLQNEKRSCHRSCSVKFVFLKISQNSKKLIVLESLFNKVAGFQACGFIKKRLQNNSFSEKLAEFLRTSILKKVYEKLFL